MTSPEGAGGPPAEQRVRAELRWLRQEVPGVGGSIVATTDGLLIAHDLPGLEPTGVAALIATTLGLARQATEMTGRGQLREAVVRGSAGYLAVFAIADTAVLAVTGSSDMNVGMLHFQTREVVGRIGQYTAQFRRFAAPELPAGPAAAGQGGRPRLAQGARRGRGGTSAPYG